MNDHVVFRNQDTIILHYYGAYNQQSWQDDDIPWESPTNKVAWVFDHHNHMVLQENARNYKKHISTIRVLMSTKLGRMVTNFERLLTINSHGVNAPHTWQGGDLSWRASTHKVTESYKHAIMKNHKANKNSGSRLPSRTPTHEVAQLFIWGHGTN